MKAKYRIVNGADVVAAEIPSMDLAHAFAETYSFLKNRNAIYGLFGVRIEIY